MEKIINFAVEHWILSSSFVILILIIINSEFTLWRDKKYYIDTNNLIKLTNSDEAKILDIRTKEEYDNGHILNSVNYPNYEAETLKKYNDRIIILVCEDGQKSIELAKQAGSDFPAQKILVLEGGLNSWLNADLPLTHNISANKNLKKRKKSTR